MTATSQHLTKIDVRMREKGSVKMESDLHLARFHQAENSYIIYNTSEHLFQPYTQAFKPRICDQVVFWSKYMKNRCKNLNGILLFVCFVFFAISRAAPAAYGGPQARGLIGAVPAGLHHSHSSVGSKLRL